MKSGLATALLRFLSLIPFLSLSRVKVAVYKASGAEIGEHVKFTPRAFVIVRDFKKLKIGDGVQFAHDVSIICDELEIGDDTRINYGVVASGPSILKIGRSCYIAPKVYIDINEPVIIEDDVGVGADYIFTHSIWHPVTEGGPRKFAPVHIKRGAWIPAGVFIMPGVTIGEEATVGARSLVVDDIPNGCLAVGVPARIIRTAEENRKELTLEEKDKIVQTIIEDYVQKIKKYEKDFSEERYIDGEYNIIELRKTRSRFFLRTKPQCLLYTNMIVKQDRVNHIEELCRKYDTVLLVSLHPLPADIIKKLDTADFTNLVWFSVESKMRKKNWRKDAMALHDFFSSHYGIRFKFH